MIRHREHRWLIFIIVVLLTVGCGKFTVATVINDSDADAKSLHGRLIWSATAKLEPLGSKTGGGFVEMKVFEDDAALPTLRINLSPPQNVYYQAWLTNAESTQFNNLGPLIEEAQGTYFLRDTSIAVDDDFLGYTAVLISEEPLGSSTNKPTEPLLFGTLKITAKNR